MTEERLVRAIHGNRETKPDASFEKEFAEKLKKENTREELLDLLSSYSKKKSFFETTLRRVLWKALTNSFGDANSIGKDVAVKHPETFQIGNQVFIGDHAHLQGRFDGTLRIGNHTWIGPQVFLDARDLTIGEYVGIGPGSKILGSTHTGSPADVPIIQTELSIRPVVIEDWADIGVSSVILPGVRIGKGSIVGAGAVVSENVQPFSIVVGVPARFLKWREGAPQTHSPKNEFKEKR